MSLVPKQIAAATIWPIKYDTLKSEVKTGRSLGYASSPMSAEPDTMQVGIPKPRIMRAMIYMATASLSAPGNYVAMIRNNQARTMLRAALDNGADNHDERTAKDGPATAEFVVHSGDQRERENGTQGVSSGNDALEGALRLLEV